MFYPPGASHRGVLHLQCHSGSCFEMQCFDQASHRGTGIPLSLQYFGHPMCFRIESVLFQDCRDTGMCFRQGCGGRHALHASTPSCPNVS